jgi:hypothetical protein
MRRICFFGFLAVAALFTQSADATLVSSYHDGFVYYNESGLYGRIDFAVYDTLDPVHGDEYLANGIEAPGDEQYIYAYQIFNRPSASGDIAYFAILDIDDNPIDEALMNGSCAQDDGAGGIAPAPIVCDTQGVWKWTFDGGYISMGEHSWLLVFSSTHGPTEGSYEIKGPPIIVVSEMPEPAMIVLLGIGGLIFVRHRTKKSI